MEGRGCGFKLTCQREWEAALGTRILCSRGREESLNQDLRKTEPVGNASGGALGKGRE